MADQSKIYLSQVKDQESMELEKLKFIHFLLELIGKELEKKKLQIFLKYYFKNKIKNEIDTSNFDKFEEEEK